VTIFAYGLTGSGKTYTMVGTKTNKGINSRAVEHLFSIIQETKHEFTYSIKISLLEIYNNKLRDLLSSE